MDLGAFSLPPSGKSMKGSTLSLNFCRSSHLLLRMCNTMPANAMAAIETAPTAIPPMVPPDIVDVEDAASVGSIPVAAEDDMMLDDESTLVLDGNVTLLVDDGVTVEFESPSLKSQVK